MRIRAITLVVSLFVCFSMRAQSGHWEGVIHSPEMNFNIEVDIAGDLTGTFTNSAMNVRGLPLSDIHVDGTNVTFALKVSGGGVFHGTLASDGKSMSGMFATRYNGNDLELPFELTRKGDAKIEAPAKSAAITKALEGRWSGTIQVGSESREIGLVLANHPDGTSTGVIRSSEGMDIPIASIVQKGASIALDVKNVGGTYAGTLKDNAIEGTWTQGKFSAPLVFHRALDPIDRWAAAAGGREKIAALKSIEREATVDVMGQSGTIHVWHTMDGRYRKEEHVGNFSTVETFDGTNGTVQQGGGAPRAMSASEAAVAKSKAFANANAMFFAFFPDKRRGTVSYDGDTIVLHPEGGVEWRVTLDPQTSLPKTMTHMENDRLITVTFVAYETIDGITIEKEIQRGIANMPAGAVIRFTKTVFNAALP